MSFPGQSSQNWGRGRGRGWQRGPRENNFLGSTHHHSSSHQTSTHPPHDEPAKREDPLGSSIDSIDVGSIIVDIEQPKIEGAKYIASYNWVQGDVPHIYVPGSPRRWTPPHIDTKLVSTQSEAFRDLNAARWPIHPLEPTIRSIRTMRPDFDLASVDILGCSHTISKLLDLVRGQSEPFRFDADVLGNTVFFTRKGASATEKLEIKGYGFRFPEVYTTWDDAVRDSISHQRVVRYSFGGLNVLLRSGTNGYQDDGSKVFEELSMPEIEVKGNPIPQHLTFDLKTRSNYNPLDPAKILPLLWLSQTPNLVIAYHEYGFFNRPKVEDYETKVAEWEEENAGVLARFHALLKQVIESVREADRPCEVSWDGKGEIFVTEQVGEEKRRALPEELYSCFVE